MCPKSAMISLNLRSNFCHKKMNYELGICCKIILLRKCNFNKIIKIAHSQFSVKFAIARRSQFSHNIFKSLNSWNFAARWIICTLLKLIILMKKECGPKICGNYVGNLSVLFTKYYYYWWYPQKWGKWDGTFEGKWMNWKGN